MPQVLSEYAQEVKMYFTSNTNMVFLPGHHVLDTNITVTNAAYLAWRVFLRQHSNSCMGQLMVEIQLVTVSCVFKYAKLVNCSFHDNLGTALTVHNTNVVLVENKFLYNECACRSFSEMRELGCGITTFNSKLKSTGNGSFIYWFIVCLINRNQY